MCVRACANPNVPRRKNIYTFAIGPPRHHTLLLVGRTIRLFDRSPLAVSRGQDFYFPNLDRLAVQI